MKCDDNRYGAVIERGEIVSVSGGSYVIKSLTRDGITTAAIGAAGTHTVGETVYYFMFNDGAGRIIDDGAADAVTSVNGKTGAVTLDYSDVGAAAASHNHALTDLTGTLTVEKGGTGATSAADARANLGAVYKGGDTLTGNLYGTNFYGSYMIATEYMQVRYDGDATPLVLKDTSNDVKNRAYIGVTSANRFAFREYVTAGGIYEYYNLPVPDAEDTIGYDILTTKNTGKYTTDLGEATTVANKAWTQIGSITLSAGTYIIHAHGAFANNATGFRAIAINNAGNTSQMDRFSLSRQAPANGENTELNLTKIQPVSASTTYYLNAYQSSGASMSVTGGIRAIRII